MNLSIRKGWSCLIGIAGLLLAAAAWKLGTEAEMSPILLTVVCAVFALCGWVRTRVESPLSQFIPDVAWGAIGLPLTFCLSQLLLNAPIRGLSHWRVRFILGSLICAVVVLLIYVVLKSVRWSVVIGLSAVMLLTTVNSFVIDFRDNELIPADFTSIATAANVAENYDYTITPYMIRSWLLLLAYFWVVLILPRWKRPRRELVLDDGRVMTGKKIYTKRDVAVHILLRATAAALALVLAVGVMVYGTNRKHVTIKHFRHQGTDQNGFIVNFYLRLSELRPSKPAGYSLDRVAQLEEEIAAQESTQSSDKSDLPTIIIIMDESFADLSVHNPDGILQTNKEVTPFINSLKENTISGYALASVFGGNTPNSEYEVLTGHSMAWTPYGSIAYQNDVKDGDYSLVGTLKGLGYHCTAMHPFRANGWKRPFVYDYLGFDEMHFQEDFPKKNLIRGFVSDQEMFEQVIDYYEKGRDSQEPQFIFGVTMQNHSPYDYTGEDFTSTFETYGFNFYYWKSNQYLTLANETDKAVEYLLNYFSQVDDDVIILFYGDHQPSLHRHFFKELHGGSSETLDEKELRYIVPFFLWANYDIPEKRYDCTSLNYLSCDLMEAAGLELTPYQQFLVRLRDTVPAINQLGYYSIANSCFQELDQAQGEEADALMEYAVLQYNDLYDRKNTSSYFFPSAK